MNDFIEGKYDEIYDRAQRLYDAGYINGLRTPYNKKDDEAKSRPRPGVAEFMRFLLSVESVSYSDKEQTDAK